MPRRRRIFWLMQLIMPGPMISSALFYVMPLPENKLAAEMTNGLEMSFTKIATFGIEDTFEIADMLEELNGAKYYNYYRSLIDACANALAQPRSEACRLGNFFNEVLSAAHVSASWMPYGRITELRCVHGGCEASKHLNM